LKAVVGSESLFKKAKVCRANAALFNLETDQSRISAYLLIALFFPHEFGGIAKNTSNEIVDQNGAAHAE
jgi:hypothetical protein